MSSLVIQEVHIAQTFFKCIKTFLSMGVVYHSDPMDRLPINLFEYLPVAL